MPELVSPAGSAEAISAAVQSGADAVCAGLLGGPAGSQYGVSGDEFGRAVEFCHVRGVKLYAAIDLCPFDDTLEDAVEAARRAQRRGADAVVVHDLGLIWAIRQALPELPIHAGEKLCIHNLDGVALAAAMGVTRVLLAPELPLKEVVSLCREAPVELEVMVHGPLCPAYGGQCLLPSFSDRRSPLRDVCTGVCRELFPAEASRRSAPFHGEELCLIDHLRELEEAGVAALRIVGRERRPEYVAAVTGVYARLLGTGDRPTDDDRMLIRRAHPGPGFTDGRFGGEKNRFYGESEPAGDAFFSAIRRDYLTHEFQRVKVMFTGSVTANENMQLSVMDDLGNVVSTEGPRPELAFHRELDLAYLTTELSKTGGTPYICDDIRFDIQRGLFVSPKVLGTIRDRVLRDLTKMRTAPPRQRKEEPLRLPPNFPGPEEPPVLTVSLQRCSQLSERLLELAPPVLYLPLAEIISGDAALEPFFKSEEIALCAVLPTFLRDGERLTLEEDLKKARELGVQEVLAGNLGHLVFARKLGFRVRAGLSMNVRNSATLYTLQAFRPASVTLSAELSAERVRELSKYLPTELIVYGRMPLMITDRCVIRDVLGACSCDGLTAVSDIDGFSHPVTHGESCHNTVWSARKLFLAGHSREYLNAGLWGVRLCFTTESAGECVQVVERYLEQNDLTPASITTGLF